MNPLVIPQPALSEPIAKTGKTVLVVDDNRVFRSSLSEILLMMDNGITVYTAENGEQAIAILETTPVSLVVTDLRMHKIDGHELVVWLNESRPATPVIVTSAYADTNTVIDLEMLGVHFFDKPLDLGKLMTTVRLLLA